MQKVALLFTFIIFLTSSASASVLDNRRTRQLKNDIEAARLAVRNAVNLVEDTDESRKRINALRDNERKLSAYFKDSVFKDRKDLRLISLDILKKQYDVYNDRLYLNMPIDTMAMVLKGRQLLLGMLSFDSLEVGKSYRKKHSELMAPYHGNLLKGGIYCMAHEKWQEAWNCLDLYLDSRKQPLFSDIKFDSANDDFAAFLALMCAKSLDSLSMMMKYSEEAIRYSPRREYTLQLLAEAWKLFTPQKMYLHYLQEGFKFYPESTYFFPRLIDYYTSHGKNDEAMLYIDKALQTDPRNQLFLLAKHSVLMSQKKYDEALEYGVTLLRDNPDQAIPNYNVGYIYYLRALDAQKKYDKSYRERQKEAQEEYNKCLPYIERYRKLMPKDRERWYPILYEVYYNLNMGKKFESLL